MSRITDMLEPIVAECINDIKVSPDDEQWRMLMIEHACLMAIARYQDLPAPELPEPGKNLGSAG